MKFKELYTLNHEGLVAVTKYRPHSEDTIELHQQVFKFSHNTFKYFLKTFYDITRIWNHQGYTRVMLVCDETGMNKTTLKYWNMLGFTDIDAVQLPDVNYMSYISYLDISEV